jgi:hypothetical protein
MFRYCERVSDHCTIGVSQPSRRFIPLKQQNSSIFLSILEPRNRLPRYGADPARSSRDRRWEATCEVHFGVWSNLQTPVLHSRFRDTDPGIDNALCANAGRKRTHWRYGHGAPKAGLVIAVRSTEPRSPSFHLAYHITGGEKFENPVWQLICEFDQLHICSELDRSS